MTELLPAVCYGLDDCDDGRAAADPDDRVRRPEAALDRVQPGDRLRPLDRPGRGRAREAARPASTWGSLEEVDGRRGASEEAEGGMGTGEPSHLGRVGEVVGRMQGRGCQAK